MYYFKILNQLRFLLIKLNCTHNQLLFIYKILLLQINFIHHNKSNDPSKIIVFTNKLPKIKTLKRSSGAIFSKFKSMLFSSVNSDVNSVTIKLAYTRKELVQIAKASVSSSDVLISISIVL